MFAYMANQEKVGSYQKAFDHTLKTFCIKNPQQMSENSGALFLPECSSFILTSLGQKFYVKYPEGTISFENSKESPLWSWRLIMLNYLCRADRTPITEQLISYRDLENGQVFYPAFVKNAITPLVTKFSYEPEIQIKQACLQLGATIREDADVSAVFSFFPNFPVTLKIWLADEELEASANILFDTSANNYLHTEDIAVTADLISNFLIKQYDLMFK